MDLIIWEEEKQSKNLAYLRHWSKAWVKTPHNMKYVCMKLIKNV